jgi:hypothetical protein
MHAAAPNPEKKQKKYQISRCLTSHGRVASDTVDEGAENSADTDTSTGQADRGRTSTVHLGSRDDGGSGRLDDDAPRLHGAAHHGRRKSGAAAIEKQAVAASRPAGSGDGGDD